MRQLVQYDLDSGGAVFLEVDELEPGVERIARDDTVAARAATTFEAAFESLRPAADTLLCKLRSSVEPPHQIEVEFGIRLNAKVGAVIAASEGEGHFQVKLTWIGSRNGTISG